MVLSGRKRSRLSWGGHVALACALCPPPIPSATPHQQARGSADPAPLDGASLGGCSPRAVCVSPHGTNRPAALDPPENLLGPHLRPPATHWPTPQAQAHGSTDAPPRDRASVGDDAATSNSARSGKLIPRGSDVVVGRASLGSPDDFQTSNDHRARATTSNPSTEMHHPTSTTSRKRRLPTLTLLRAPRGHKLENQCQHGLNSWQICAPRMFL